MTPQEKHAIYTTLLRLIEASQKQVGFSGALSAAVAYSLEGVPTELLESVKSQLEAVGNSAAALEENTKAIKALIEAEIAQT